MKVYEVITGSLNISMKYGDDKYCNHSLEIGDLIFIDESKFYVQCESDQWPYNQFYKSFDVLRKIRFMNSKCYLNEDKVLCTESFFDIIDDINILNPKINGNSIKQSIELGHIKQSVDWERHIKLEELGI
jgi:hypothetical protein